ncbi:hypothetical protein M0804_011293 [Polistes exclamans]|nr:hypothetical protein M0804_011293 [Polistes exclamans]
MPIHAFTFHNEILQEIVVRIVLVFVPATQATPATATASKKFLISKKKTKDQLDFFPRNCRSRTVCWNCIEKGRKEGRKEGRKKEVSQEEISPNSVETLMVLVVRPETDRNCVHVREIVKRWYGDTGTDADAGAGDGGGGDGVV